jgi:hypothetical protein
MGPWVWVGILTRLLPFTTPVSRLLTYLTHTHHNNNSNAVLKRRIEDEPYIIYGLSTAERTGSPVLHTLWSYVIEH